MIYRKTVPPRPRLFNPRDLAWTLGILAVVTLLGDIFQKLGFSEANIITINILGVLITAGAADRREYGYLSAVASVLIFNFLFTQPRYALKAEDIRTQFTLLIMLLSAFITSSFAARIKEQAGKYAMAAYRAQVLLETSQLLQKEKDSQGLLRLTAFQLNKLLKRDTLCCGMEHKEFGRPETFTEATDAAAPRGPSADTLEERAAARWVYYNRRKAGASSPNMPGTSFLYLPVLSGETMYGLVGIRLGGAQLDSFAENLAMAVLGECAMALEKEQISRKREEEAAKAKTEELRSTLLRSISHDLRTPLTSISGNAGILLNSQDQLTPERREQVCQDIYDDSMWLISLVENLLSITRMEGGGLGMNMEGQLLEEIVAEALRHVSRNASEHTVRVVQEGDFIMARMDSRLIIQVLINLVNNAVKYTPAGSVITVRSSRQGQEAVVEVIDDGPGIPDEAKERIFDMFYTTAKRPADSRRGLGLGLALCRSVIAAHGGSISVRDNLPHGSIFQFTLPVQEVKLYD